MNSIETNEILEMREQLASLKKRLENQEIVNEKMIREAMSRKLSTIHRRAMALCVACIIGIPAVLFTTHNLGCSMVFAYVTVALILVGVVAQFLTHYRIGRDTLSGDLITTYNEVARMKRIYQRWHYFSMPIFVAWLGWGAYEVYTNVTQDESQLYAAISGSVVGLVLGLIFGLRQHRQNLRTAKEIMQQIETLKGQK
ncbi:MAG: hypothetical protein IKY57_03000 [Alistipes sp.]|nr:hypothetical protein [Alistipes sp.]